MTKLLCPCCGARLDGPSRVCANGHSFGHRSGVLELLSPKFEETLRQVEQSLAEFRKHDERRITDPAEFKGLPFNRASGDREWAMRARDAVKVARQLPAGGMRVLDIGAWNGWLSHLLAERGHSVVAIDYFADEFDGLGAVRHYEVKYEAIQMDVADLSVIDERFDLVIVNHGLAFFTDPVAHVRNALSKVRAGGKLIVLGLQFFRDATARIRQVEQLEARFRERCGSDLFFRPTRGLLDWADLSAIKELGLTIHPYRYLWWRNLLSRARPRRPFFCYATAVRQN